MMMFCESGQLEGNSAAPLAHPAPASGVGGFVGVLLKLVKLQKAEKRKGERFGSMCLVGA